MLTNSSFGVLTVFLWSDHQVLMSTSFSAARFHHYSPMHTCLQWYMLTSKHPKPLQFLDLKGVLHLTRLSY